MLRLIALTDWADVSHVQDTEWRLTGGPRRLTSGASVDEQVRWDSMTAASHRCSGRARLPSLDPESQAVVDVIRKSGWEVHITREDALYCAIAWQTGGAVHASTGTEVHATVRTLAEKISMHRGSG